MSSSKEYLLYVLEQTKTLKTVSYKPMMGEYLLYLNGVFFGGIYDDRLLLKITDENKSFSLPSTLPYPGAKPMFLAENPDDADSLCNLIVETYEGLMK